MFISVCACACVLGLNRGLDMRSVCDSRGQNRVGQFGETFGPKGKVRQGGEGNLGWGIKQELWVGPAANLISSHICLFGENPLDSEAAVDLQAGEF